MRRSGLLAGVPAVVSLAAAVSTSHAATNLGEVMPLGDSITWGDGYVGGIGTGVRTPTPGGYRTELYERLTADGYALQLVGSVSNNSSPALTLAGQSANEGHPGYGVNNMITSLDGHSQFEDSFDPGYWLTGTGTRGPVYPDDVLLMAGVNNLRAGITESFLEVVEDQLLDKLYALRPATHVYLAELTPDTVDPDIGPKIVAFNAYLASEVPKYAGRGDAITLVDTYDPFTLPGGAANPALLFDGLHPNQLGYNAIGDTFAAAIEASVPEPAFLAAIGCCGLLLARRRRGRAA